VLAPGKLCEEELGQKQFKALMDSYIYSEQEPLRDDVFKCLSHRPSVLKARQVGERIIAKMKEFVEVFVRGVAAKVFFLLWFEGNGLILGLRNLRIKCN